MRTLLRFASTALFSAFFSFSAPASAEALADSLTPPRLGLIDGQVSYWRTGAPDWVAARLNTPLAAGDTLYAADGATFELQIGSQAYVRGGSDAQIALVEHDPDFLQFNVSSGQAAFDLRALTAGASVEIDTPNATFSITHSGYYRLDVDADSTRFITRRGGSAEVTRPDGQRQRIGTAQEIELSGNDGNIMLSRAAPPLDTWDRWNFARSDAQQDAISARYVPAGVYGIDSLDRYGTWQQQADYGAVWVPSGLPANWAPYSDGNWVLDPVYGWSWIDAAPWGWAPFHYGRWVRYDQRWAWAPGPRVVRPVYAPALVAFFGFGNGSVSINIGQRSPALGWVALGWGEPVLPWWGGRGHIGRPQWSGWGGPRVVNNVTIRNTQVVNISNIHYQNTRVSDAVIGVPADRFGHGQLRPEPLRRGQLDALTSIRGALPIQARPASRVAGAVPVAAPPHVWQRQEQRRAPNPTRQPTLPADQRRPMPEAREVPPRDNPQRGIQAAPNERRSSETPPGWQRGTEIAPDARRQIDVTPTPQRRIDGAPSSQPGQASPSNEPRRIGPARPTLPQAAPEARPAPAVSNFNPPPHGFGRPRMGYPQPEPALPNDTAPAFNRAPESRPNPPRTDRIEPSRAASPPIPPERPMPQPDSRRQPMNFPARENSMPPAPRPIEQRPVESRRFEPRQRAPEMQQAAPAPAAYTQPAPAHNHGGDGRGRGKAQQEERTDRP